MALIWGRMGCGRMGGMRPDGYAPDGYAAGWVCGRMGMRPDGYAAGWVRVLVGMRPAMRPDAGCGRISMRPRVWVRRGWVDLPLNDAAQ